MSYKPEEMQNSIRATMVDYIRRLAPEAKLSDKALELLAGLPWPHSCEHVCPEHPARMGL